MSLYPGQECRRTLASTLSAADCARSLARSSLPRTERLRAIRRVGADSKFARFARWRAAGRRLRVRLLRQQKGLTVTWHSVKNYTPVTDAMLKNPDPGDWLMIRRNYQAWSHSPLAQVTASNVKDLQLAWSWSMNEGGANEPTPIVHNGTMFLGNTGNVVQALDARTGELIWENDIGPELSGGLGAIRSLAVYQDKVYIATTDVTSSRAQRPHRQKSLGHAHRRSRQGIQQYQRTDRGERQGDPGDGRVRPL